MILLIDNYDSFTYNVYQAVGKLYSDIKVARNDEITIEEIENLKPQAIIVSPGPKYPSEAGISEKVIKHFAGKLPILGICLGHQAICEVFGGKITHAATQMHGKASVVKIDNTSEIFKGLSSSVSVARYHSLIAEKQSIPECLKIIATDDLGQVMAVQHKQYPIYGLQFHPESILTEIGEKMIANFLEIVGVKINQPAKQPLADSQRTELKKYIAKVVDRNNLTTQESSECVDIIMGDRATFAQTASLLTALRMKGETIDEITGFAQGMRDKMAQVETSVPTLDIVGTGGDLSNSFNISTTSSFVISAAGQAIAKHGNRSVSSKSGAADVLEKLGVKINSTPELAKKSIEEIGISFLFAQSFHPAMRFVGPVRGQIGIRTIFNILGPLSNPAKADYMLLGVYDESILEPMAKVLANLGVKSAMLVYGQDRIDEISISAKTSVCEIKNGKLKMYELNPEDYGFKLASKSDIVGGTAEENAKITLGILKGEITDAKRDIVLLNAGCSLYVSGKAKTIENGIELAKQTIDSGKAYKKLQQLIEFTNRG